jgi:hypothetical protein
LRRHPISKRPLRPTSKELVNNGGDFYVVE